jgi:hypothetical protein
MSQNTNPELTAYLNKILDTISPDEQIMPPLREKMLEEMEEQFQIFLNDRLVNAMDEESQVDYLGLLQSNPAATAVEEFLQSRVPAFVSVVSDAAAEFANLYVDESNKDEE